ncbi:unnamed protein product [Protopolystoma xenopodis]|uniref:K Homology domain-containing protein n=1 Tax=Protopolystoma xenopodis TaxID=117903 RepID=A0A448WU41_9PLAT|nr:unnamed protein product [Protopolystoma xenopodis]
MRRTTQGGLDGDLSAVNDPLFAHHEVFRVEQPLVGLAIGAQGHNIRSARGLPGIGAIDMIDFVQLRDSVSSSSYDDSYSYRAIPQQRSRKAGRDRDSQDAALSQPDLVYEPNRSGLVPCSVFSIYAKVSLFRYFG